MDEDKKIEKVISINYLFITCCIRLFDSALWHSCFDLFSVCSDSFCLCQRVSVDEVCAWKLDRDSNVFIYYKLITGLRKVTNVHFPYLCLLTSQGK